MWLVIQFCVVTVLLISVRSWALVIVLALIVDSAFRPPFLVHVLIWVPFTAASTVGSLRMAKAALLAAEYRNKAREAVKGDLK